MILLSSHVRTGFHLFTTEKEPSAAGLDEFASRMRGDMAPARVAIIREVFAKVDATGDGVVTIDDLRGVFDVDNHPSVIAGTITPEVGNDASHEHKDLVS